MRLSPADGGYPANTAGGGCYISGCTNGDAPRAGNTYYVDAETQIDMEGWLVICQDCLEAMMTLAGSASEGEVKQLKGRIRNLEAENAQMETELRTQAERVRAAVG